MAGFASFCRRHGCGQEPVLESPSGLQLSVNPLVQPRLGASRSMYRIGSRAANTQLASPWVSACRVGQVKAHPPWDPHVQGPICQISYGTTGVLGSGQDEYLWCPTSTPGNYQASRTLIQNLRVDRDDPIGGGNVVCQHLDSIDAISSEHGLRVVLGDFLAYASCTATGSHEQLVN